MVKVLYLGGCTRSGSTLVDRAMGQLPGFVSTGELGLITTHGICDNRLCGCGARFRDCPFWTEVGRRAFGGWESTEARELVDLHPRVTRQRYLPALLSGARLSPRFSRTLRRYRSLLGRLYAATAEVAGASVVVDSTKAPAYALVLRGVSGLDVRVAQLVRDSRGTAYSAGKVQRMQDSVDRVVMKHRYPPLVITGRWVLYHTFFALLGRIDGRRLLVRYEDFIHRPRETVAALARYMDVPVTDSDLSFVGDRSISLHVNHTTAGNDMRLLEGDVRLREDDEWRRRLPAMHRRIVTAASWPLLRAWGYGSSEARRSRSLRAPAMPSG